MSTWITHLLLGGVLLGALPAAAHDEGRGRVRDQRGYASRDLIRRVRSDIMMVERRSPGLRNDDRRHLYRALEELDRFDDRWRKGRWDSKPLDKTIDHLKPLVRSRWLDPRGREMLARNIEELRAFRASRGYGYSAARW